MTASNQIFINLINNSANESIEHPNFSNTRHQMKYMKVVISIQTDNRLK